MTALIRPGLRILIAWLVTLLLVAGCGRQSGLQPGEAGQTGEIAVSVNFGSSPAPGAIVQLLDAGGTPLGEQRADEQGGAIFKNVPLGAGYQAIATLEGATGRAADLRVAGGQTKATIVLAQGSGPVGLVVGSVRLAGADRPLANVAVEVAGKRASTDANGQFRLDGVPAGPVTVKAQIGGYAPVSQALVVKPGGSSAVTLVLQPLATGPKAGHTLVATPGLVLEFDAWRNAVGRFSVSQAWSAVFLPDGGILVADAGADRAQTYSDGGAKGTAYTGRALWQLGLGGVKDPRGASRTPQGNVLVADTGNNRILELDGSNRKVWEYKSGLSSPRWAERLPSGNTLIADSGNNRVVEVKSDGGVVWGLGDGSTDVLNHPTHVQRLPGGNTLVCDAGNGRVMEVNPQNQLVWMAPGRGGDVGRLSNPSSAKRLVTGNTLVADTDANQVIELSPDGTVVWKVSVQQPVFADRF